MPAPAGQKEIRLTASGFYASLLINGDYSSLTTSEVYVLREKLEEKGVAIWACVDCVDVGWLRNPDIGLAGDCMEYVFWVKE